MIKAMRGPIGTSGLQKLSMDCCGGILVEIGCFAGESSRVFADSGRFNRIYCVDPWSGVADMELPEICSWYKQYDMNAVERLFDNRMSGCDFVTKMKMSSEKASREVLDTVDMVYIDAVHTYKGVKHDIELWQPKIRTGGWICGHDYSECFSGVIRAVDELLGKPMIYEDSSWAVAC